MAFRKYGFFFSGLVLGLALAAGSTFYVSKALAERSLGPYVISEHSNPTATAGVFRVNVNTGYVSYCYIDAGARPQVSCTAEAP